MIAVYRAAKEYKALGYRLKMIDVLHFIYLDLRYRMRSLLLNRKWVREYITAQIQLNLLAERKNLVE